MGPAEANRKTIESINKYLEAKREAPLDTSKADLLQKHGFKDGDVSYETYIKVTIPKTIYDEAKCGEDLKAYLIEKITGLL